MDWSYGLLTEPERVLLCRVSVFACGFTLEAAEGVCCGDAVAESEILNLQLRSCRQVTGGRKRPEWGVAVPVT